MIYLYTTTLALSGSSIDDNDDDNVLKQIPEHNVTHHLCATDDLLSNFSALSALATPINENIRYVSWHGRVYFGFGGGGGLTSKHQRRASLWGVCRNPPPEYFEILKLKNATFIV